jgi:hypothetical protein
MLKSYATVKEKQQKIENQMFFDDATHSKAVCERKLSRGIRVLIKRISVLNGGARVLIKRISILIKGISVLIKGAGVLNGGARVLIKGARVLNGGARG